MTFWFVLSVIATFNSKNISNQNLSVFSKLDRFNYSLVMVYRPYTRWSFWWNRRSMLRATFSYTDECVFARKYTMIYVTRVTFPRRIHLLELLPSSFVCYHNLQFYRTNQEYEVPGKRAGKEQTQFFFFQNNQVYREGTNTGHKGTNVLYLLDLPAPFCHGRKIRFVWCWWKHSISLSLLLFCRVCLISEKTWMYRTVVACLDLLSNPKKDWNVEQKAGFTTPSQE
jgi:hypothetical protein